MTGQSAPVTGVPVAPPLPADLEALLRRMRFPHMRTAAPDILATARAQRWDPAEVLKHSSSRRSPAVNAPRWPPAGPRPGSPPGRRSTPGSRPPHRSPPPPNKHSGPWNG